jgi:hypothetical protein
VSKNDVSLSWQADAAEEVGETWVAPKWVESGIHPDVGHSIRTGEISFLEPGEGALVIAQGSVYACDVEPANVPPLRLCLDLA